MRRIPRNFAGAVLILVMSWGCASDAERGGAVRMAYPPIIASLPLYLADEHDLFAGNGLELQKTSFTSSNDMVTALVAGQVDVLPAVSLIPIIHLEIQHPGRVRVFSHSRMRAEAAFDAIIVSEASPIREIRGLRGARIGVFPGTSATNMLKLFLSRRGVDTTSAVFVQLAPQAQLGSLQSGAIDALFTYEPVTTTAELRGGYRRIFGSVYADLLGPNPIGASVISRPFERQHAALARAAIAVIDTAVVMMRREPAAAKALLTPYAEIPADVAARVNVVDVTLSSEVDVGLLQRFIDLLFEAGEIPERIDARRLTDRTQ